MRSIEFHPDAQDEFISAAQFYENQSEGLGLDFILTVQRTYERLLESAAIGQRVGRRLRRVLVPKFPYGLLYRARPEQIYIGRSCTFIAGQVTGDRVADCGIAVEFRKPRHAPVDRGPLGG